MQGQLVQQSLAYPIIQRWPFAYSLMYLTADRFNLHKYMYIESSKYKLYVI